MFRAAHEVFLHSERRWWKQKFFSRQPPAPCFLPMPFCAKPQCFSEVFPKNARTNHHLAVFSKVPLGILLCLQRLISRFWQKRTFSGTTKTSWAARNKNYSFMSFCVNTYKENFFCRKKLHFFLHNMISMFPKCGKLSRKYLEFCKYFQKIFKNMSFLFSPSSFLIHKNCALI